MKAFDVCIIGGGPSGYAAAMRAVDFGRRVLLVERDRIGGAGTYDGALSSKTLWELSREFAAIEDWSQRFHLDPPQINYREVVREVDAAVAERADQLLAQIALVQKEYANLLQVVKGFGRLLSPHEVEVENDGHRETYRADNIIVATGSRPRYLPEIPIDEQVILTSDGIGRLEHLPESIVILGAGVIGCEFATIFANFGRTRVFLIDKEPRILPFEDPDLSRVIENNLERAGAHIHHGAQLESLNIADGRVIYVLRFEDGRRETFHVEKALVSVGRVPNYEGLGLAEAGVELTERGHVVDNDTRSSVPNILAIGDLTADIALVNVGELEGRHAIEKLFGQPRRPLLYENISTIMFLKPETAAVGINELQAQAKGLNYRVASYEFEYIARAIAMRRTQGFFKILVTDDEEMKVLGMRAVGEHASSAIQAVALLISIDHGIDELAELIHPHPSIIEGVQECARMLRGKSIFKTSTLAPTLVCRRYHNGQYKPL